MLDELIIYYLKKKRVLLNMSFLVLKADNESVAKSAGRAAGEAGIAKIQLSLLQYMACDEALTARSSRNYPQMK